MADSIIVKAGLQDSEFHAGMGRMQAGALKLNRALKLVGASLSVGGLAAMGRSTLRMADDLGTAASTIGVTTDYLQEFQYAAEQSGVGADKATMGLQRFTRRLAQAQQGTGELLPTLRQLGIAMFDQEGKARSAEDVMNDFADALANIEDPQAQLLAGFKAFDSEGAQLITMLKNGSKGLQELRNQAHDAGVVLDSELIKDLDQADKTLKRFGKQARVKFAEYAAAAVRAFKIGQKFAERMFDQIFRRIPILQRMLGKAIRLDFTGMKEEMAKLKDVTEPLGEMFDQSVNAIDKQLTKEKELLTVEQSRTAALERQTKSMEEQRKLAQKKAELEAQLKTAKQDRSKFSVKELAELDNANAASDPILTKIQEQLGFAKAGLDPTGKQQVNNPIFERAKLSADRIAGFEALAEALKRQGLFGRSQRALEQADKIRAANPFLKSNERNPFKLQEKQLKVTTEQLAEAKALTGMAMPQGKGLKVIPQMPNR